MVALFLANNFVSSLIIVLICLLNIVTITGAEGFNIDLQKFALAEHNLYRAMHGSPPLQEDLLLQSEAQKHAEYLAATNRLEQNRNTKLIGNIGASSMRSGEHAIKAVMKLWYAGIKHYDFSNPGFNSKAGTFTSIVWKASTKLGIGIAYNRAEGNWIIVSYYSPTPNMEGRFQDNVFPLIGTTAVTNKNKSFEFGGLQILNFSPESIPNPPEYSLPGCPEGAKKSSCQMQTPQDKEKIREWLNKMKEWESSLTEFGKTNWEHVYPDHASDMKSKQFHLRG